LNLTLDKEEFTKRPNCDEMLAGENLWALDFDELKTDFESEFKVKV